MRTVPKEEVRKAIEQWWDGINLQKLVNTIITVWTIFITGWPQSSVVSTADENKKGKRDVKDH